ncbi:MAG: ATP-binding protein [Planctomycetota bacterium]|jgi:hypothetical protein
MYEYQKTYAGLGQIHDANVGIFGNGIAMSPSAAPRAYSGITPSRASVFGSGRSVLPARPPSPVTGIENCAMGNCLPYSGLGTTPATSSRPWWHYAALGIGVSLGYVYLKRSHMQRNPDQLTDAEVVKQAAAITIQAGIPTILWGPPGIGKTQWVQGLGEAMAPMNRNEPVKVITLIGSTKDPTDIGGMPTLEGGTHMPGWARELRKRSLDGERSILFLDEFSSMSAIVHAALLRVVNEKIAGDKSFDPKSSPLKGHAVHIVMAANRKKHGASAMDLPPPAANRIIHFEWPAPTAVDWAEGMLFGWKSPFYFELPADWRKNPLKRQALEEISAFLRYREGIKQQPILFDMPAVQATDEEHGGKKTGGAWPSPRSWELASDALGAAMVAGAPKDVQLKAVEGAVGVGAAYELFGFRKFEDLPDPERILRDPKNWDVPEEEIRLFIVTGAIANAVARKVTLNRFNAAWAALEHAYDETEDTATIVRCFEEVASSQNRAQKVSPKSPGDGLDGEVDKAIADRRTP